MKNVLKNAVILSILLLALTGCAAEKTTTNEAPANAEPPAPPVAEVMPNEVDKEDPTLLRRPFTPEEIRDEWQAGLTITFLMKFPSREESQRWTVKSADEEGCEIEFAVLDENGEVVGEPNVQRSTWVELRDHANFKAESATFRNQTRLTELGELEGWFYEVRGDEVGIVNEYFFAKSLPGAPVHMRVLKDGEIISEMIQKERQAAP